MRNIFIIGNGFDLAHGLKTSYGDFLEDLEKKISIEPEVFIDIIEFKNVANYKIRFLDKIKARFKNRFLDILFRNKNHHNWSDIEYLYYKLLKKYDNQELNKAEFGYPIRYKNPIELNREFEIVKNYLQSYLIEQQKNNPLLDGYQQLFNNYDKEGTVVLNFNYTNTVSRYLEKCKNIKLINIHGQLEKPDNPIIFGYAASDAQAKELLEKNDTELLLNIKRYNYHLTNNESNLKYFLGNRNAKPFVVNVLGHSCGVSDRLILSDIFNHKAARGIRLYYYEDNHGYKTSAINIARIVDDYSKESSEDHKFSRLSTYPNSSPMLQYPEYYKKGRDVFNNQEKSFVKFCTNPNINAEFIDCTDDNGNPIDTPPMEVVHN